MSYRRGIGADVHARRLRLFLAAQAMLVWNLAHGQGCKRRAKVIAQRTA